MHSPLNLRLIWGRFYGFFLFELVSLFFQVETVTGHCHYTNLRVDAYGYDFPGFRETSRGAFDIQTVSMSRTKPEHTLSFAVAESSGSHTSSWRDSAVSRSQQCLGFPYWHPDHGCIHSLIVLPSVEVDQAPMMALIIVVISLICRILLVLFFGLHRPENRLCN